MRTVYINVKILIIAAVAFVLLLTLIGIIAAGLARNKTHPSRSYRIRFNRRKRESKKLKFKGKKL